MWKLRKMIAFATFSFRHSLMDRGDIIGRGVLYVMLLFVFSRLWKAIDSDAAGHWSDFIWYLALTEWVLLSVPNLHLDIESDVRSGDIVSAIPRPISYVGVRVAEGIGGAFARLLVLGSVGFVMAWSVTGSLPHVGAGLWQVFASGSLGVVLGVLFSVLIGLSALWIQDVGPCYWAWQKTCFIFGGLLVPLDLYPEWLRNIAAWTPCHAMLYATGSRVLERSQLGLGRLLIGQLSWIFLASLLLALGYRLALRRMTVNGG